MPHVLIGKAGRFQDDKNNVAKKVANHCAHTITDTLPRHGFPIAKTNNYFEFLCLKMKDRTRKALTMPSRPVQHPVWPQAY